MEPKKILIIDDEVTFSRCMKMNLELSHRFVAHIANSGKEGIKMAKSMRPDIILLDITMPHVDGFQVLEAIKKDPSTISIPVIMLSALSDEDTKIKASSMYSQYYVTKPISADKLIEKIDWVLGISKGT